MIENPKLKGIKSFDLGRYFHRSQEIQQSLIIVDGIVAFKGSANLTFDGWSREGEIREVVMNFDEVMELNKKYFVPFYKKALER